MSFFRAFKHRSFALLWCGQTISSVGDFLYEVVLAWWVLEKTGSALIMGTVLICSFAPMIVFLLIGGVAVDRLPRAWVMLISDVLRGGIVTLVTVLGLFQILEVWHILVASMVFGIVDAFFRPAYAALVPELVPEDDLPSANALTSMSVQIGRVAGPALGASVIALVGTTGAFGFNAFSFVVAACFLAPLLRSIEQLPVFSHGASIVGDIREGIGTILANPILGISMLVFAATNILLSGPYSIAMPFLVKDEIGGTVGTLGILYATFPVGYILGGLWAGRQQRLQHRGVLMFVCFVVAGLMLACFSFPISLVGLMIAALINGAALEISGLIWTNIMQEVVPGEQLGRVSSVDALGSFGLLPLGYAVVAWATDLIGAGPVFVIGGGLTMVCAALALLHPSVRAFD